VRSCRSYSLAKGPGTSARAFPMVRSLYLQRIHGVLDGVPSWAPRGSHSPVLGPLGPLAWVSSPNGATGTPLQPLRSRPSQT
jgi:hypothetical protein